MTDFANPHDTPSLAHQRGVADERARIVKLLKRLAIEWYSSGKTTGEAERKRLFRVAAEFEVIIAHQREAISFALEKLSTSNEVSEAAFDGFREAIKRLVTAGKM